MAFTSDVLVGRTQIGQRQTVKEQGKHKISNYWPVFHYGVVFAQSTDVMCTSDQIPWHVWSLLITTIPLESASR